MILNTEFGSKVVVRRRWHNKKAHRGQRQFAANTSRQSLWLCLNSRRKVTKPAGATWRESSGTSPTSNSRKTHDQTAACGIQPRRRPDPSRRRAAAPAKIARRPTHGSRSRRREPDSGIRTSGAPCRAIRAMTGGKRGHSEGRGS